MIPSLFSFGRAVLALWWRTARFAEIHDHCIGNLFSSGHAVHDFVSNHWFGQPDMVPREESQEAPEAELGISTALAVSPLPVPDSKVTSAVLGRLTQGMASDCARDSASGRVRGWARARHAKALPVL